MKVARMTEAARPRRRDDVETYVLPDGSSLLYDPEAGAGYPLDVLRSLIWDYCDGTATSEQIAVEVAALLSAEESAREYTLQVLGELAAHGLLQAETGEPA